MVGLQYIVKGKQEKERCGKGEIESQINGVNQSEIKHKAADGLQERRLSNKRAQTW